MSKLAEFLELAARSAKARCMYSIAFSKFATA